MVDSLLEIEVAYNLLQSEDCDGCGGSAKDPIDAHFDKLRTKMEVVARESDEFKMLQQYVTNTHAATHTMYTLEIEEVRIFFVKEGQSRQFEQSFQIFKISRKGEAERFRPFKEKLKDNRMLLWHGSRITNFAGILSQGLRIAPPEAPVTGYMFGKGIYFADMVSKSANYCSTSRSNSTGLMLLCDVALGSMYERTQVRNLKF